MGLNRPIYHLMIGLYGPEGTQDLVRSFTVIGQSADHLRNALAGINPGMRIAGEIATPLSQAFQRVDEIAVNEPTPPVRDMGPAAGEEMASRGAVEQMLDAIFEGRAHIARDIETGAIDVLPGPPPGRPDVPHDVMEDLADGKIHIARNETGTPVIMEGPAPSAAFTAGTETGGQIAADIDAQGTPAVAAGSDAVVPANLTGDTVP